MWKNSGKLLTISVVTTLLFLIPVRGWCVDFDQLSWESTINWEEGTMTMDIEVALGPEDAFYPSIRRESEYTVKKYLPQLFLDGASGIKVDSYETIGTLINEDPELVRSLENIADRGVILYSRFSKDMTTFLMRYQFQLFPEIVSLFIIHTTPYPPPRLLEYEPTTEFSGIVIYAMGAYPVHGEETASLLNPCFFPTLFDPEMNIVVEKGMVNPAHLKKWGLAAYTSVINEKPFVERIGFTPFRTMATALFGKNRTDIILPSEAARKILYSDANRKLLTEGRILIICDTAIE